MIFQCDQKYDLWLPPQDCAARWIVLTGDKLPTQPLSGLAVVHKAAARAIWNVEHKRGSLVYASSCARREWQIHVGAGVAVGVLGCRPSALYLLLVLILFLAFEIEKPCCAPQVHLSPIDFVLASARCSFFLYIICVHCLTFRISLTVVFQARV